MNKVLQYAAILILAFTSEVTTAQVEDEVLAPWKEMKWNLPINKRDDITLFNPTASEDVLRDDKMWERPDNPDTSFTLCLIRPSYLGFGDGYDHDEFLKTVFSLGFTTVPKSVVAQVYLEESSLGEPFNFSTIPVIKFGSLYTYTVGPNPKGSTPVKKAHDLYLKPKPGKKRPTEVWVFAKKTK
ncbi:MAG: hypothetical protein QG654_134 [Patescibacteria group bacterium]|jgi:hypothetical protein|nr:hypothetical protein [Patescibacteria group bacterium]